MLDLVGEGISRQAGVQALGFLASRLFQKHLEGIIEKFRVHNRLFNTFEFEAVPNDIH